jgi:hypothetical protein
VRGLPRTCDHPGWEDGTVQITLTRTGGFAGGISELGPVDTGADAESGMLEALVLAADFFALAGEVGMGRILDDRIRTVTVAADGRRHRVGWTDGTTGVPDGLAELFRASEQVGRDHGQDWRPKQA